MHAKHLLKHAVAFLRMHVLLDSVAHSVKKGKTASIIKQTKKRRLNLIRYGFLLQVSKNSRLNETDRLKSWRREKGNKERQAGNRTMKCTYCMYAVHQHQN